MKRILIIMLCFLICFSFVIVTFPIFPQQTGWVLNMQGRLFGTDKVPKTGSFDFTVRIYDAPSGGVLLWGPKTYTTTVNNGLYNFEIGPFTKEEIANVFNGEKRYVALSIDNNPNGVEDVGAETLSPRISIVSNSLSLNTVLYQGKDITYFIDTSGTAQTKQGNLTLSNDLIVNGNFTLGGVTLTAVQLGTLTGGAASNADMLHTHKHSSLQGLGDDDHLQYIHRDGRRAMTGDLNLGGNKITNLSDPAVGTDAATKRYVDNTVSVTGGGWTDDGAFVRLTTITDFVGIGTNTPSAKLQVSGNVKVDNTLSVANDGNAEANITLGSLTPAIRWQGNSAGSKDIRVVEDNGWLKIQEKSGADWITRYQINLSNGDTDQQGTITATGANINGPVSINTTNGTYIFQ